MIRRLGSLAFLFALAAPALAQQPTKGGSMPAPIVFFDIAGPDFAGQKTFYSTVFGWEIGPAGNFTVPVTGAASMPANLRKDRNETIVYLGVEDVTAALAKVTANGGKISIPRMVVPGVTIFGVFFDPSGNRVGLVEIKDGKPITP